MNLKRYNKATAAVLGGAAVAIAGAFFPLNEELRQALEVVVTAGLVYLVPNIE